PFLGHGSVPGRVHGCARRAQIVALPAPHSRDGVPLVGRKVPDCLGGVLPPERSIVELALESHPRVSSVLLGPGPLETLQKAFQSSNEDIPVVPRKALLKVPAQPRRPFLARKREARTQDGLRSLDPSPRGFQSNRGEAPNAPSRH